MDDLKFRTRSKRGDFTPRCRLKIASVRERTPDLVNFPKRLPGYNRPWKAFHMATAPLAGSALLLMSRP